jgi:hypothetical protein
VPFYKSVENPRDLNKEFSSDSQTFCCAFSSRVTSVHKLVKQYVLWIRDRQILRLSST